jgi:hypothetical protein
MKKISKRQIGPAALCSVCGRTFGGPAGSWHLRRHISAEHPDIASIDNQRAAEVDLVAHNVLPPVDGEPVSVADADMRALRAVMELDSRRLQNLLPWLEDQAKVLQRLIALVHTLMEAK